ncbi:MAG: diacylglycerol kinase [Methyloceanibacter sp.]
MSQKRTAERRSESAEDGLSRAQSALPGRGGLARIMAAFWNSLGGLQEGLSTESAIKQEAAIACLLLPFTFFIARDLWTWVALVGSLLFVLSIEFLNTAIERLCNHIHPDRHEAIRITKDLASAGVFFALALAALVWIAALLARFGLLVGAWG